MTHATTSQALRCLAVLTLLISIAPAGADEQPADLRAFVRTAEPEPQLIQLEIAIRRFKSADPDRPAIDLVGVVHVGESGYYEALQTHLDEQPLVLFEGIGQPPFITDLEEADGRRAARTRHAITFLAIQLERYHQRHNTYPADVDALLNDVAEHEPGEARWTRAATRDNWDRPLHYEPTEDGYELRSLGADGEPGGDGADADLDYHEDFAPLTPAEINATGNQMQPGIATALGLVFQLDVMNYDRPHYRHSDMSFTELTNAIAARRDGREPDLEQRQPDPLWAAELGDHDEELDEVVRMLDGTDFTNTLMTFAQNLLTQRPGLQQFTRLLMIDVLGQIEGDLAEMPGLAPSMRQLMRVLITDRNRIIVQDLRDLIEDEDNTPEAISVFYGAAHMPDLARQLRDELDYHPSDDVQWLPAFTADFRDSELDPQQVEFIRGMIRFQLRTLNQ
ncbi:MAG: type II secretion system protein GspG [Phycisphaeraceae bacterium]